VYKAIGGLSSIHKMLDIQCNKWR